MKGERTMKEATAEAAIETGNVTDEQVDEGRFERVEKLAKNHILASMGVGLIPIPLVDLVALVGIQLDMIKKLSAEYDVPFRQDIGKSIISSLVGGILPVSMGGAIASLIKFVPVIGQTTSAVTMPVISGASTYAIYKVFLQHYESGGTILDMDPSKVKSFYSTQFTKGKKVVADLKTETA